MVNDPLKAVPEAPFGHHNAAWQTFLGNLGEEDELWSFSARWETEWKLKLIMAGYVAVRDSEPGLHIHTVCMASGD